MAGAFPANASSPGGRFYSRFLKIRSETGLLFPAFQGGSGFQLLCFQEYNHQKQHSGTFLWRSFIQTLPAEAHASGIHPPGFCGKGDKYGNPTFARRLARLHASILQDELLRWPGFVIQVLTQTLIRLWPVFRERAAQCILGFSCQRGLFNCGRFCIFGLPCKRGTAAR